MTKQRARSDLIIVAQPKVLFMYPELSDRRNPTSRSSTVRRSSPGRSRYHNLTGLESKRKVEMLQEVGREPSARGAATLIQF